MKIQLLLLYLFVPRIWALATQPKKVLIVGGGIGGLSSAFDAKHNLRPFDEVTVVSDNEYFQFTPSNPWVATRKRKVSDISLALNDILPRHGIEFVHAKGTHLNPEQNELALDNGETLSYDYLIIATGPKLAFDEIPGAAQYCQSVCTTPHASHTAKAIDELVRQPGPIVVGSTQGASCFGPAYEFALLLCKELEKRGGKDLLQKCPMSFVTSEPYIGHLGLKGAGESKEILEGLLTQKNIDYFANCKIQDVTSDSVSIQTVDESGHTESNHVLPSKFTMLIPPFHGMDMWKKVDGLTDSKGMVLVNEHQQSPKYPNVFGVGVCTSIPPVDKTPVPTGPPKTGYMIESQGTAAVKNIQTMIDLDEKKQPQELCYRPLLNGLCITDFGDDGAIFLTLPQYPPRRADATLKGKMAVLAKIAFEKYFLHKIETGDTDPYYEKYMLHLIGVDRVTSEPTSTKTTGA